MVRLKQLGWLLCFAFACGLLLLAGGGNHMRQFLSAHHDLPLLLLLSLLLAIPAGVITIVAAFLIELLHVGWSNSSLRSVADAPASVRLDLLAGTVALIPHRWLSYVLSAGILYAVDTHVLQPEKVSLNHLLPWWGLQLACVLLLQSFVSYWIHRLEHTIPALWALHKFHHSADRMCILTTSRQTELTKGVEQFMLLFFLALLTEPTLPKPSVWGPSFALVGIFFAYRTFMGVNHYLCHSNLTTDYGWFGRWFLVSPRMHRLHHATQPQYHNSNFTFDLVLWDRLFGTYANCDLAQIKRISIGLDENPFNGGAAVRHVLRDYLVTPYRVLWKELRTGMRAWIPAQSQRLPVVTASPPEA